MYRFIYFFFLKLAEKRRNPAPQSFAAFSVMFVQLVHSLLGVKIIETIFQIKLIYPFSKDYTINRYSYLPMIIIGGLIVHFYYKKRYNLLHEIYSEETILTLKNAIIVYSIALLPLFLLIYLIPNAE